MFSTVIVVTVHFCIVTVVLYFYKFCIATLVFVRVLYTDSRTQETSLENADLEVSELLRSNDTASYDKRTQFFNHTPGKTWCRT